MTYTDAAVEVLRRLGQPTHFKEIAERAVAEELLSHVGGAPETTMGARLLAMSNREGDRRVISTEPGIFALAEWGLEPVKEPTLNEPPLPGDDAPALRPKERHPPLQDEIVLGNRRDDRRRRSDSGEGRRKRYGPPAELAHAWLLENGKPAAYAEIAAALRADDKIAEALERDLSSLEKALTEENRRRSDQRRPPLFEFNDDGTVSGLELPKVERAPKKEPKGKAKRERVREEPPPTVIAADEQRKLVLRALRRRLAGLDVAALERVVVALLEAQGYSQLNMARRSAKEGPLYLCRHRFGAGELRYAVRVLRSGRDVGRAEVEEVRRDASHFSAQIGAVFGNAECNRDARSEANTPGGTPVMLYGNEALAEALIDAGLGVTRQLVEWFDYDDAFFASIGAEEPFEEVAELTPAGEDTPSVEATETSNANEAREEPRGRRRRGRGRRGDKPASAKREPKPVSDEPKKASAVAPESADVQVKAPTPEFEPERTKEPSPKPEAAAESSPKPEPAPKPVSKETSEPEQT